MLKKFNKGKKIIAFLSLITLVVSLGVTCYASPSLTTTTAERNSIANNWSYYALGQYEYNCLAYAMDNTSTWVWPWDPNSKVSETQVNDFLFSSGYTQTGYNNGTGPWPASKICSYGWGTDVRHFARITTASVTSWTGDKLRAKWGHCEIFSHTNSNPYTNNVYGPLLGKYR